MASRAILEKEVPVTFKIDTGAEVTAFPEAIAIPFKATMREPSQTLLGADVNSLNVCGQFTGTLNETVTKSMKKSLLRKIFTYHWSASQPLRWWSNDCGRPTI